MKRYRIGDFARELGVTPDFLKYCEKQGYITPHTEPNGYRYYDFTLAAPIIEYIKLKNQGFSAKAINELLCESSFDDTMEQLIHRREAIRRQMVFHQALLQHYDQLSAIWQSFRDPPVWQVRRSEGFYFLPHSVNRDFIAEDAVRTAVRAWMPYMPVVMSTRRIACEDGRLFSKGSWDQVWGLSVDKHFAQQVELPVSAPVVHVPPARCLELFMRYDLRKPKTAYFLAAEEILARNALTPCGASYTRVITKIWENGVRNEYSILMIPVKD